jgi:hypothetical protein
MKAISTMKYVSALLQILMITSGLIAQSGTECPQIPECPRYPYKEEYEQLKKIAEKAAPGTTIADWKQAYGSTAPIGLATSILPESEENVYPFKPFTREDYVKGGVVQPEYLYEYRLPTEADLEAMKRQESHYLNTFPKKLHRMQNPRNFYERWSHSHGQWNTLKIQEEAARVRLELLEAHRKKVNQWLNGLNQEQKKLVQEINTINAERASMIDATEKRRIYEASSPNACK